MANELTDLDLGEWSICFDPVNEDSLIEIVKSKAGLAPALKETDMSDNTDLDQEGAGDAEFEQFAEDVLTEFNALSAEEQAQALVELVADNSELEDAVEDATEVVKALTVQAEQLAEIEPKFEELKKSAASAVELIEKMKREGGKDEGPLGEIRKALRDSLGGAALPADAEARLSDVEKSLRANERKEAIAKAKDYGFGKPEDVADLETGIRKAMGKEAADKFVALVRQAGGLAKSSPLFKAIGEDAGADAGDPVAKAKNIIDEIKKAEPALTEQQAFAKAIERNPGLYRELEAARRAA